jgi:hypothetical protein
MGYFTAYSSGKEKSAGGNRPSDYFITSDWPTGRSEQALEATVAAITPSETV